ncbi:MAG: ATP-dependent 6-phosphofructokinase [Candidatus Tectimicrobiota bacterium]|nr:MAG: ATP-dependent 6-phosphofructokinase [Candidatus Tectomicrobia bacterium]
MSLPAPEALRIETLGPCRIPSPLQGERFVDEARRVLVCTDTQQLAPYLKAGVQPPAFELAGPRAQIFFRPETLTCGIVTCGGLCPGLNNVIRSLVLSLTYAYGVRRILGFRYGYAGLASKSGYAPLVLTPEVVDTIHEQGGTLLGTSRGPQDVADMVDTLVRWDVGVLFAIGGDGTLRGAAALSQEIARRGLKIGVVGIPKTIDNDLEWIERSFGFATAVEEARRVIVGAHAEARGAWNGIGLVKLMGRHSGFIAAHASLANSDVNFCLVPEVPFTLEGEGGFLQALERRLERKHHAVVVVAEGAGQELLQDPARVERDPSGNIRLKDIGAYLRDEIVRYFARRQLPVTVKYIDPSYTIRSLPANSLDAEYCLLLGQHAVHAGLAGRTNLVVGYWNQHFTHVPIALAVARRKQLDPQGETWQRVLEATGQPASLVGH